MITWMGKIGLDPLKVPEAAAMATGSIEPFQQRLDAAAQRDTASSPADERPAEAATTESVRRDDAHVAEVESPGDPQDVEADDSLEVDDSHATTGMARQDQPERARTESRSSQPEAPATGKTPTREPTNNQPVADATPTLPANAAAANQAAQFSEAMTAASASARAGQSGTSGDRVSVQVGEATPGKAAAVTTTTGYRTMNQQSVRMVEQARDSIFKQILFKLGKDSGEMRMRLEPPQLGELDLHMQVDKHGQLRLSIGAELDEVRELLLRDLDQLKRALGENGLSVTHAEVHDHKAGNGSGGTDSHFTNHDGDEDIVGDDQTVAPRQRIFTAEGLDFWV